MITIEKLKALGADAQEGLARCMGNEQFYLMLIEKALSDDSVERLEEAVKQGDLESGFEIAHSLKGVFGNLSLTPLYDAVVEITELLRNKTDTDYSTYIEKIVSIKKQFDELIA